MGHAGFDPARDVEAITFSRWPHGYAWNPNPLFNAQYTSAQAPHEIGRKPYGRITVANSDAGARAYLGCAIDEAWRAPANCPEDRLMRPRPFIGDRYQRIVWPWMLWVSPLRLCT